MSAWPIRTYPWCSVCEQRAVARPGDACPGCMGRMEIQLDPIVRAPLPPAPPRLLRVLRWLGGHVAH